MVALTLDDHGRSQEGIPPFLLLLPHLSDAPLELFDLSLLFLHFLSPPEEATASLVDSDSINATDLSSDSKIDVQQQILNSSLASLWFIYS